MSGGHAHHGGAWKVAYADFVEAAQPNAARAIGAWLDAVRRLAEDRRLREPASAWCDAFERQALVLRDIGSRVEVVDGDDRVAPYPLRFLQTATDVLDRYPLELKPDGGSWMVTIDGTIEQHLGRSHPRRRIWCPQACRTHRARSMSRRGRLAWRSGAAHL